MSGACSKPLDLLLKLLAESGAVYYHERNGRCMFSVETPFFKFLTSYDFFLIRTDLEILAKLNDVKIQGATPPYAICTVDVTSHAFEFDAAFVYYLSTLPEYEPTHKASFGIQMIGTLGFRVTKPHCVKISRIPSQKRGKLSFPIRVGTDLYTRTANPYAWRSPIVVLREAMQDVAKTEAFLTENERRRLRDDLHPDYRSLMSDCESLALRVALINSKRPVSQIFPNVK